MEQRRVAILGAGTIGESLLRGLISGGWVEGPETAALLEPYEEWAGLASVYLMAGFQRGLVPLRHAA